MEVKHADLPSRVTTLEGAVTGLREDVGEVRGDIAGLRAELRNFAATVTNASRTPWGVLASWAAVVIAGMAAIGTLATQEPKKSIARNESGIEKLSGTLEQTRADLARLEGVSAPTLVRHEDAIQRLLDWQLEHNAEKFTKEDFEEYRRQHEEYSRGVQAEIAAARANDISDVKELMASEIRRLDENLQREMRLLREPVEVRLQHLEANQNDRIRRELDRAEQHIGEAKVQP